MKLTKIFLGIVLLCVCVPVSAQLTPAQEKEAIKIAKKEAKKLIKEGWMVPSGELPIERQLIQSYMMSMEKDEDNQPKYVFGQAISGGDFYDAAKLQASESAKANLIGNLSTDMTRLIDMQLQNQQKSAKSATSLSKITAKSKSLMSQKLGALTPVVEIYRNVSEESVEVQLRVAYERAVGVKQSLDLISKDLEDEGINLAE